MKSVKNNYKHFLFDFDGVIADSFEACYGLCDELASGPVTREEYRRMHEGNIYELESEDEKIAESITSELNEEHFYFKKFIPIMLEISPFDGMGEVVSSWSQGGSLHVITSSLTSIVEEFLSRHKLRDDFQGVYGADVHPSKLKKMETIFEKYNTSPSDCLMVTDTLGDLREAERAGVDAVAVSWGFHTPETLAKGNPLKILHSPQELLDL
ncbi:MAG: HAD family hydrolase [Parcubacteria group bacterium]|nr:HAD family hydrolase [Parcubacteria group bacterium]